MQSTLEYCKVEYGLAQEVVITFLKFLWIDLPQVIESEKVPESKHNKQPDLYLMQINSKKHLCLESCQLYKCNCIFELSHFEFSREHYFAENISSRIINRKFV